MDRQSTMRRGWSLNDSTRFSAMAAHERIYASGANCPSRAPRLLTLAYETVSQVLMLGYKRNQVEEAISRVLEPRSKGPSAELRTRLKRLLDTDRSDNSNGGASSYAFYSGAPPGRGLEVWFSGYEAFALMTGLSLMNHSWPQGFVVSLLREVRSELERQHARILKQDPDVLFDEEAIRKSARRGDMAVGNTDQVFLTIVSKSGAKPSEQSRPIESAVCRERELWAVIQRTSQKGGACSMLEIVNSAHQLASCLANTEPQPRGRNS